MWMLLAGLLALIILGILALRSSAHRERIDRQLALAMPTSQLSAVERKKVSIQRTGKAIPTMQMLLKSLLSYEPHMLRWPALYTVFGGIMAGIAAAGCVTFAGYTDYVIMSGCIVGVLTIRGLFEWQRGNYKNLLFRQLPDTLSLINSRVQAGLPVSSAFESLAGEMPEPTRTQFKLVNDELALGQNIDDALHGIYTRTQVTEYAMFAVTLSIQMKSGGRLTEILETLAKTIRDRVALAGRARALAGEVTFSARALSFAPFIIGAVFYWVNPVSMDLLFTDPRGRVLLIYAFSSVVCGSLVMRWMIKRGTAL